MNTNPIKNNKPFVKGDPRINRNGQPKKNYTQIIDELKAKGYKMPTKGEYFEMIGMLLVMEEKDLEEYAKNKERPYWIRLIIIDLQNKNTRGRLMADYRDWLYGRSVQAVKHSGEIKTNSDIKDLVNELTRIRTGIEGSGEKDS